MGHHPSTTTWRAHGSSIPSRFRPGPPPPRGAGSPSTWARRRSTCRRDGAAALSTRPVRLSHSVCHHSSLPIFSSLAVPREVIGRLLPSPPGSLRLHGRDVEGRREAARRPGGRIQGRARTWMPSAPPLFFLKFFRSVCFLQVSVAEEVLRLVDGTLNNALF